MTTSKKFDMARLGRKFVGSVVDEFGRALVGVDSMKFGRKLAKIRWDLLG